jgi:uncharacterized cupin superfamily protein
MIDLSAFSDLAGMPVGPFADKPTTHTPGQQEATAPLWSAPDGSLEIGVWECTPGRFSADRSAAAEFCYFLSGRIVMTHIDGTRRELGPGDAIMLPRGWKGDWEIVEHTRKIYAFQSAP